METSAMMEDGDAGGGLSSWGHTRGWEESDRDRLTRQKGQEQPRWGVLQ